MPPLRPLSYRETVRRLRRAGFVQISQRGSHVKFTKESEGRTLTAIVPRHRELIVGTLKSILDQAGLTEDEFGNL